MTKRKTGNAGSTYKKSIIDMPNLIEIQNDSYRSFLQEDILPEKRTVTGLEAVFREVFPIKSYDEKASLEYVGYTIGVPKYNVLECQRRGLTFSVPLNVTFRLRSENDIKEENVYMGNIPKMTETGTFIINGAERVIVSQLHRSPGICFEQEVLPGGLTVPYARIIPYRGSWLEAQFDSNNLIFIYLDRLRRRKILATTFLRALGFSTNEDILSQFYEIEEVNVEKRLKTTEIEDSILAADLIDASTNNIIAKAGSKISKPILEKIKIMGVKTIKILKSGSLEDPIVKMIHKDSTDSKETALKEIYKKLRPGDPPTIANATALIKRLFFDPRRYDLEKVGRFKLNQKLGLPLTKEELEVTTLKRRDIVEALRYLLNIYDGSGNVDDIDHLGNRRVRSVGELVQNQCRIGLARMERVIKERMNLYDFNAEMITPHKLINPKSFSSVIKDFFGRSQLSQFMDQTNPLSELTHKRRLSALGPGGLSRERAGFEVRDVHPSHYGRMCPIETPEGPNIGLIASLSTYAKINEYGFIETPYRKVENGYVIDQVDYLTADVEERHVIAQANAVIDEKGKLVSDLVSVRYKNDTLKLSPEKVQYMDVSPMQLVSVAAGLIPFLEHDDANRALMGSNMQRQSVPLLDTEEAYVSTGLEEKAARDSGVLLISEDDGVVEYVDGDRIRIAEKDYHLRKFLRSNAGTTVNQRPIVKKGDKIKKGDIIADSMATKNGKLSLGRNVLVAFMPWEGYNFEDAIVMSEKLLKEDIFTSIHVEDFELGARDTKLGKEEITRDIPGLSEEVLRNLDEDGVVYEGAEVKPNDVLVGKITPKSETELSPEERLLRAIFGEKAADVRPACLEVPSGTDGIVIDVKSFSRRDKGRSDEERVKERQQIKEINEEFKKKALNLRESEFAKIREILVGQKLPVDIIDGSTGEIVIPGNKKITEDKLKQLEMNNYEHFEMEECPERDQIREILWMFQHKMEALETNHSLELEKIKKGDELEPGVIKKVKVYIATKRKLSVGDKMAGRHGNKGVIAKIVPEEDMPFLADGTPVDMILNPLGVPSRMNVGQVLETHLGWAASKLGLHLQTPVFEGIPESKIKELMREAGLPETGKAKLYDGRTGNSFDQQVVVGFIYMMKLAHIAADKIHARATGPYSLVTQQPLGGKAQFGGQRFGEMEVWALEAYGAAYTLQEILTVKSDDVIGRTRMYESIVKGQNVLEAGTPESFNVLVKEIQSLALDIRPERG